MAVATKRKLSSIENCTSSKTPKLVSTNFGASFRKRLKTDDAITVLKEFVETNKERDVVTEYINAGGSAKELLSLMKKFDGKKDLTVANPVLAALECVVSKSNTDLLLIQKNVEEACEELLCDFQHTLQNMLSSTASSTSHRKVVLKLFTGMVNLSNGLAKRLLTLFPINVKAIKILTDTRQSSAKLRTCFIHYLLSFLVDDNIVLISELLQKKGLLSSIIPGLTNDPPNTVVLVLNTLRLKIVENIRISKTHKLHTFNTSVLRSLDKLYDYSISVEESSEDSELISQVEETVKNSVHLLLMTLCTSHKKGVLFKERSSAAGKSLNQLIFTLLEDMSSPWDHPLRTELVTEILKSCPEFMKSVYHTTEPYIQPSPTEKWINLMNFMSQIIEKQEFPTENKDAQKTMNFIASFIFPSPIQKLLREINEENIHPHPVIRFHILSLMRSLLSKIKKILYDYPNNSRDKGTLDMQLDHFLNKHLLPSSCILKAYKSQLEGIEDDSPEFSLLPELDEYSSCAADVLLLYGELTPLSFNQLRIHENIDLSVESRDPNLLFKLAQLTFQIYNPKPGQDQFLFMIKQFLECYISGENTNQDDIIQNVLLATGFFDGFEEEIIIWLNCMKKAPSENASLISDLISTTLCALSTKHDKFIKDVTSVSSPEDTDIDISNIADTALFVEQNANLLNSDDEFESFTTLPVKLSPVVPAFLYTLKNARFPGDPDLKVIRNFSSSVLLHLLHTQCNCCGLAVLLEKYKSFQIEVNFLDYLAYWDKSEIDSLNSSVISDVITKRIYDRFMSPDDSHDSFESFSSNLNEMDYILSWNTCIFYSIQLQRRNILRRDTISDIISTMGFIAGRLQTQSALCLKLLLTNHSFVNSFSIERNKSNALTEILLKTMAYFQAHEISLKYCSKFLSPFRQKFMLSVLQKITKNKRIKINCEAYTIDDVIRFVSLSGKQVVELLSKLLQLPTSVLINEKQTKLSEWSVLMNCLFKEAASNLDHPLMQDDFNRLIVKIIEILKCDVSVDDLEDTVVSYLRAFPHHIQHLRDDDVENLLSSHPRISKLAIFLIQYRPNHLETLQSKLLPVENHLDDVAGFLDILNKIQLVGEIDEKVLLQIYKSEICDLNKLLDGCAWLTENKPLIVKIIQQFAEKKKCSKMFHLLESNWSEYELDIDKYDILRIIFEKASKTESLVELSLTKLNQLLGSDGQTNWLCEEIISLIDSMEDLKFVLDLDIWKDFVKSSLKYGLQCENSLLINTLRSFCGKLFEDNSAPEESSNIFQMTISHSEFINVMLSDLEVKYELVELLMTLTTSNTSLMSSNHVPLLLGSYKATLSKCDQAIFQLLRAYENAGIRFSDCRPYLWGDAAVTHHSIRTEISVSLKRLPLPSQVLELLDGEIVKNTIRHYPLDRPLKPSNEYVEYDHKMYDISFMLPLMSHLLAPESRVSIQKFTRSGALALILSALASQAEDTRMAAYHCLQRFKAHLFSREKEIQLWDHFANALQSGVCANRSEAGTPPRLPSIVTTFLAQMSLIIGEPLHPLYISLTKFLLAKPTFDVNTVPNFLALFYSIDEKHKDQQEWILTILKYGMRYKADWMVAQKCFLYKLLLQYSFSAISTESIDLLILDVLVAGLRIPECRQRLVTKNGLLSWITQIIRHRDSKPVLGSVIEILSLLSSVKNSSKIIHIVLQLLRKIRNIPMKDESVEKLMDTLARAYCSCKMKNIVDEDTVELVISTCSPMLDPRHVKKYRNCLRYKSCLVVIDCGGKIDNNVARILRCYLEE